MPSSRLLWHMEEVRSAPRALQLAAQVLSFIRPLIEYCVVNCKINPKFHDFALRSNPRLEGSGHHYEYKNPH